MQRQRVSHSDVCQTCGGTGLYRYNVPPTDHRFGRIYPCRDCNLHGVYKAAGLTDGEAELRVSHLETKGRPGTKAMVDAAMAFYKKGMTGFLSLCGGYGVGKTHVMKAIAAEGVRQGFETYYTTLTELLLYIREAYSSNVDGDSDYGRIRKYAECRLLLVDEIDKAKLSEYAMSLETHLFDQRYRSSKRFGTVLAWNGDIGVIKTVMPWLASRLEEFIIAENNDSDFRLILREIREMKRSA